jgi:hypothetical protein
MLRAFLGPISRTPTLFRFAGVPGAGKPSRRSKRTASSARAPATKRSRKRAVESVRRSMPRR